MLAGDGMSQVTKTLLDLTQRKNFYAGDLLISVEILRNVTDTFKRASYIPASDGVQVREYKKKDNDSTNGVCQYTGCHLFVPLEKLFFLNDRHTHGHYKTNTSVK